ncbi:MAG TPA: hypothetical protein VFM50_02970 [Nocardioidaceae bacterium]|nr:hypothetical protein [Nocardioidaceae bacterium]
MGVSLTGSGPSMAAMRSTAATVAASACLVFYCFGPMLSPVMQAAAASACNRLGDGSFRHYRLEWQVGLRPHWRCWDTRDAARPGVDLGWWVTPTR